MTMLKKTLYLLCGIIGMNSFFVHAQLVKKLDDCSPQSVEFAWDLHETLVMLDKPAIAKAILNTVPTAAGFALLKLLVGMATDYPIYLATGKTGKHKQFLDSLRVLLDKSTVAEEYFELIQDHDPRLRAPAEKMAACYKLVPGMLELLEELSSLGYTQRLASNIGDKSELTNIKERVPEVFKYLEGGKAVAYENRTCATRKPELTYYLEYQQQFNPDRTKTIIFVDDDPFHHHAPTGPSNTQAAEQAGMIGITFKSCQQLRSDLKQLGIPLK